MSDSSRLTEEPDLRIVLIGKTGAGKSATGNTILRRKAFLSEMSPSTVTLECQKETAEFEGQTLAVVDTPGQFDDMRSKVEVQKEFVRCISLAAPGPHVFLVVIQANRFTEEEQQTVKIIQNVFGKAAAHYTMVLFTHGDDLEADGVLVKDIIDKNKCCWDFVHQCHGGYHVFNNRDDDPSQVRELLKKINKMVQKNGGNYYTNGMFKENKRAIKEEMERLQGENPNMKPEKSKKRKKRKFIGKLLHPAALGGSVGAGVGTVGGPVGSVVGAAVGIVVGASVAAAGFTVTAAVKKMRKKKYKSHTSDSQLP